MPDSTPKYDVGFEPSICPQCGCIELDTDIGATLCPYHADPVTMEVIV